MLKFKLTLEQTNTQFDPFCTLLVLRREGFSQWWIHKSTGNLNTSCHYSKEESLKSVLVLSYKKAAGSAGIPDWN